MSSYSRDQRSGGGTPPQFIATVHQIKCLPLGVRKMTSRPAMRNHLRGSRRELRGTPGVSIRRRKAFSPSGFPLQ